MALHAEVRGSGRRVVLLHGFTQTSVSWAPVADRLAPGHEVVGVDLPGHGGATDVRADLAGAAALVAEHSGGGVLVGYSMGGRVALRAALDHPDAVSGLVLVGATAGIDDPDERAARRRADEELADRIERDGVEPFLERWLAQPLFAGFEPTPADLAARRANTAAGLASSLRLAGTGTMDPPWWSELGRLALPVRVVAGRRDHKFTGIGHRLVRGIGPSARFVAVSGAGHAAHLEQPEVVAGVVADLAAGLGADRPGGTARPAG